MLEVLTCRLCGGDLQSKDDGTYVCPHCGRTFVKKTEDDYAVVLKSLIDDAKLERLSAARQNLWAAMHEEYISSSSCVEYARELKSLVPSDYYANFAEAANGKNDADLSKFLNSSSAEDMETYADAVLDFMLKSLTAGTLTAMCAYIDRAYKKSSPEYVKYEEAFEREAEKVSRGVYELSIERDVFLAYSSADTGKVIELCDFLEDQGITCFLSMRNLRHGRGAADNYDAALREAMDNCRTIVFLSSKSSRNLSCDALRKELPYMRTRDMEFAPSEYKNLSYDKLPARYKKPRVEYLLDDYTGTTADALAKQIFDGYEWCKSKEEVAERVVGYLTAVPMTGDAHRTVNIGDEDIRKIVSAVSESDKTMNSENSKAPVSMAEREKNVINQAKRLIAMGDFSEAEDRIVDLEKEEKNISGVCSALIYYYKLLIDNEVRSDEQLVEKFVAAKKNLSDDKNFRSAKACDDSPEKMSIMRIEERIEGLIAENERKEKEQREKEDAAWRAERERKEAEKRQREEEDREYVYKASHWSKCNSLWKGRVLYHWTRRSVPVLFIESAMIVLIACIVMNCAEGSVHLSDTVIWDTYSWVRVLSIVDMAVASVLSVTYLIMEFLRSDSVIMYDIVCIAGIVCMAAMLVGGVYVYRDVVNYFNLSYSNGYPGPAPKCIISVSVVFIALTIGMLVTSAILRKSHSGYIKAEEYGGRNRI